MGNDANEMSRYCQVGDDPDLVALARQNGLGEEAAKAVAAIDATMHRMRRNTMRRDFGRQMIAEIDPTLDVAHLDVIASIGRGGGGKPEEVTVGLIAERLGIDPSRASRVAAEVVERGYAQRIASQADARRICLELTPKGERFVAAVRLNKWNLFARALGQWNEADLVTFARLFERFSGWATDSAAPTGPAVAAGGVEQAKADPVDAK